MEKLDLKEYVFEDVLSSLLRMDSLGDTLPGLDVRLLPHQVIGVAW
jgi:hypothetical protein